MTAILETQLRIDPVDGSFVPEVEGESDELTNTQWIRTIQISNQKAYDKITEMVNEGGYPLLDIREFIDDYGISAFIDGMYEVWEELEHSSFQREAIEEFIEEFGISELNRFEDAYYGCYSSEADFAEQYYTDIGGRALSDALDAGLRVDWQDTFDHSMSRDFTVTDGGWVFSNHF